MPKPGWEKSSDLFPLIGQASIIIFVSPSSIPLLSNWLKNKIDEQSASPKAT